MTGAGEELSPNHVRWPAVVSFATRGPGAALAMLLVAVTASAQSDSIPLRLARFDGRQGPVVVSNGIPLRPGALRATDLSKVRLMISGTEHAVRVEALAGRFSDGSLRSVLIQFEYAVPASDITRAALVIGRERTASVFREPEDYVRAVPAAVALPAYADYLVSTQINGPTVTSRVSALQGGVFAEYERRFVEYADKHWRQDGSVWSGANYYDRALIYFAFWVRTANPIYFRRATLIALDYRTKYLEANRYEASAHWSQAEGLEQHYLLTGDEKSRFAVARVAEQLAGLPLADTLRTTWMETRIQARTLQALYLAWRIDARGPRNFNLSELLDEKVRLVLSTQRRDGSTGWPVTCFQSLNYMHGLLNDQLINIHDNFRRDTAIVRFVRKSVDYLWSTQWISSAGAFKYLSGACPRNAQGEDVGGPYPTGDLNMLFVTGFGWMYNQTGDPAYRRAGDQIFAAGIRGAYWVGSKQFNQTYTSSYKYLAWRLSRPSPDGSR